MREEGLEGVIVVVSETEMRRKRMSEGYVSETGKRGEDVSDRLGGEGRGASQ